MVCYKEREAAFLTSSLIYFDKYEIVLKRIKNTIWI